MPSQRPIESRAQPADAAAPSSGPVPVMLRWWSAMAVPRVHPAEGPEQIRGRWLEAAPFLLAFIALAGICLTVSFQAFGDGPEYLGMAASLMGEGNLSFSKADQVRSADLIAPDTYLLDTPFGHLTKINLQGRRVWGTHSFYYPALAVPFVCIFGGRGFLLLNALCLVGAGYLLYRFLRSCNSVAPSLLLAGAFLLLSPMVCYVFWVHAEVLQFTAVLAALMLGFRQRPLLAGLCLGIAIALKPMMAAALLPIAVANGPTWKGLKSTAAATLAATVVSAPQFAYNLVEFGSLQSMQGWVSASYLSILKMTAFAFDPIEGMVWTYPALAWCLFRSRWHWPMTAVLLLTSVVVALACSVGSPFHTHQVGWRYCALIYPFFLVMAGRWRASKFDWACAAVVCALGAPFLVHALGQSGIYYPRFGVASAVAHRFGIPAYPESFFGGANRLDRRVTYDFVDNNRDIRDTRTQIQIREATEGEAVVVLYSGEHLQPGKATLGHFFGPSVEGALEPGRVTTLRLPVSRADLVDALFHELRNLYTPVARLSLTAPTAVKSGQGDLFWQRKYFENPTPRLYRAGPTIAWVFPSRDDILGAWAFEGLGAQVETLAPADRWDDADCVEGRRSLAHTFESGGNGFQPVPVILTTSREIPKPSSTRERTLVTGWFKFEPASGINRGLVGTAHWLDGAGKVLKTEPWQPRIDITGPNGWQFSRWSAAPPKGALRLRLEFTVNPAQTLPATLRLDGVAISRYYTAW